MASVRVESIEEPLLRSPEAASLMLSLVSRGHVMGFLPEDAGENVQLDRRFLSALAESLANRGVAVIPARSLARAASIEPLDDVDLVAALRSTLDAVDASPVPEAEWGPVRDLIGDDTLEQVLGISQSSVRRYASGARQTPDEVAWRLHVVARVLAALLGSYNDYGIRRWLERPRSALDGSTPADVFAHAQGEDDPGLARVVALAEELTGASAAD